MSKLFLPKSQAPVYFCKVPGCEQTFRHDERDSYFRHVPRCARKNTDKLEQASAINKLREPIPVFDPEAEKFLRERYGPHSGN